MARPAKGRTAASAPDSAEVRLSVPLAVREHALLCWLAANQGRDRSAVAAEFITKALAGIVVIDKRKSSDPVGSDYHEESAA